MKKKIFFLLFFIGVNISFCFANFASAEDKYGIDTTAGSAGLPKITSVPSALGNVVGVALSMISVIFFVLMLYAGIRWMVARGNEEAEEKAKETIIGAVIGMVIIMLSYALTTFVFKGAVGEPVTSDANVGVEDGGEVIDASIGGSIGGDVIKSCKPKYTADELKNFLEQGPCNVSAISSAEEKQNTCNGVKIQGAKACEFSGAGNTCTVITGFLSNISLITLCNQGDANNCDKIEFQMSSEAVKEIGAICKLE